MSTWISFCCWTSIKYSLQWKMPQRLSLQEIDLVLSKCDLNTVKVFWAGFLVNRGSCWAGIQNFRLLLYSIISKVCLHYSPNLVWIRLGDKNNIISCGQEWLERQNVAASLQNNSGIQVIHPIINYYYWVDNLGTRKILLFTSNRLFDCLHTLPGKRWTRIMLTADLLPERVEVRNIMTKLEVRNIMTKL